VWDLEKIIIIGVFSRVTISRMTFPQISRILFSLTFSKKVQAFLIVHLMRLLLLLRRRRRHEVPSRMLLLKRRPWTSSLPVLLLLLLRLHWLGKRETKIAGIPACG